MLSEPNLIIQQWETAGNNLVSALATFVESSLALERSSIDPASEKSLCAKIGLQWNFIDALAPQQLLQARISVGRTRNRITPLIHRLPKEILARIFRSVAYPPRDIITPFRRLKAMYRDINTLGRVCLAWRDLILSRSDFWTLVPITDTGKSAGEMTRICFQRAGHVQNLHLVARFFRDDRRDLSIGSFELFLQSMHMITSHPQRIRTLNLSASRPMVIADMIDCLIHYCAPGSITELSISLLGHRSPVIFPPDTPQQTLFNTFLGSLCVLCLKGFSLYAGDLSFSRLRELRLHEMDVLPQGALVRQLLPAIAPDLHVLQISHEQTGMPDIENPRQRDFDGGAGPIPFPSLQALYLLDLPAQAMAALLQLIAPGSYRIIVQPTLRTLTSGLPQDVQLILRERNVSELSLDISLLSRFHLLPGIPPFITTLHMHRATLDKSNLGGLTSPPDSHFVDCGTSFPRIRELHLNAIRIKDQDAFKAMISSHPIERLHMMGNVRVGDDDNADCLKSTDELAVWLRSTIPIFRRGYFEDGHPFHAAGTWDR